MGQIRTKTKIDDADRALTDEVIRCNNSFALAALQYLKMTTESANAIKEADELGILNTLDPAISKQLRKRVGMRFPLPSDVNDTSNISGPSTKSSTKKEKL